MVWMLTVSFIVVVGIGCFGCVRLLHFFRKRKKNELRCDVALWELSIYFLGYTFILFNVVETCMYAVK